MTSARHLSPPLVPALLLLGVRREKLARALTARLYRQFSYEIIINIQK